MARVMAEAAAKEGPGSVDQFSGYLFPQGSSCSGTEKAIYYLKVIAEEYGVLQTKVWWRVASSSRPACCRSRASPPQRFTGSVRSGSPRSTPSGGTPCTSPCSRAEWWMASRPSLKGSP
jgi:hypothetical protein